MHRHVHEIVVPASPGSPSRAFVGVVSRAHVLRGVQGGFAMLNHGRREPLAQLEPGDWLVYYSPRTAYPDGAPLKAFTALGRVTGEAPYAFDMGGGFVPFRRDVAYVAPVREVPIAELAPHLAFTRGAWGMLARRGSFEITRDDFQRIADAMAPAHALVAPRAATARASKRRVPAAR